MSISEDFTRDFPNATSSPQDIVNGEYKYCTRRTYFLRLHRASAKDEKFIPFDKLQAAADFVKDGRIDLARIPPSVLIERLNLWITNTLVYDIVPKSKAKIASADCAITYAGLKELGLNPDLLKVFRLKSKAFYQGAYMRAQQHLNDTDASDPQYWAKTFKEEHKDTEEDAVDVVLIAHFAVKDKNALPIAADAKWIHEFETYLLANLFDLDTAQVGGCLPIGTCLDSANGWLEESIPIDFKGSVYFGYKDGITAPKFSKDGQHGWGELLLGHPRNGKDNPYGELPPYSSASPAGSLDLDALNVQENAKLDFFFDSSFGVLRKMQQDVAAFEKWVKEQAANKATTPSDNSEWELWIKAKLLGRTAKSSYLTLAEGSLMTPHIEPKSFNPHPSLTPMPKLQDLGKEAGFKSSDPKDDAGMGCPFGSHIRRMNPRDDFVVPFIARPLLRRGMTYQTKDAQGIEEVGLSGIFLCADITEQFEHLVGKWANGRVLGVDADPNSRDPIIGNHQAGDSPFLIRRALQEDLKLKNPAAPFVVTRGCLYAWFPNKAVLQNLSRYLKTHVTP